MAIAEETANILNENLIEQRLVYYVIGMVVSVVIWLEQVN